MQYFRPSLPIAPPSAKSDLERGSPILWYNSTGRYFSYEPNHLSEKYNSRNTSPGYPAQSHAMSPIHQWSTHINGDLRTWHFEECKQNFSGPIGSYPNSPIINPAELENPSQSVPDNSVNSYSHGTQSIASPNRMLHHPSNGRSSSVNRSELADPVTSTFDGSKDKRRSRLRFLTLPLFRGLRFRNKEKKPKKGTSEEDERFRSPPPASVPMDVQNRLSSFPADFRSCTHCNWYGLTQPVTKSNVQPQHLTFSNAFRSCFDSPVGRYYYPHTGNSEGQLQSSPQPHSSLPVRNREQVTRGWIEATSSTCDESNRPRSNLIDSRGNHSSPRKFSLPNWSPWHVRKVEQNSLPNEPSGRVNPTGYVIRL